MQTHSFIKCKCDVVLEEREFLSHFGSCSSFKKDFKSFDQKFGEILREYSEPKENLLIVKVLLNQYKNMIDNKIKQLGIQVFPNNYNPNNGVHNQQQEPFNPNVNYNNNMNNNLSNSNSINYNNNNINNNNSFNNNNNQRVISNMNQSQSCNNYNNNNSKNNSNNSINDQSKNNNYDINGYDDYKNNNNSNNSNPVKIDIGNFLGRNKEGNY